MRRAVCILASALALASCKGEKGDQGPPGPAGPSAVRSFISYKNVVVAEFKVEPNKAYSMLVQGACTRPTDQEGGPTKTVAEQVKFNATNGSNGTIGLPFSSMLRWRVNNGTLQLVGGLPACHFVAWEPIAI